MIPNAYFHVIRKLLIVFCLTIFVAFNAVSEQVSGQSLESKAYAIESSATVQILPPKITLNWPHNDSNGASPVSVYRKAANASVWGNPVASLANTATSYEDTSVVVGTLYEYWISQGNARGYISAGMELPLVENRGKVILLVDNSYGSGLLTELARLEQDLTGDGWTVVRRDVARNDTVINVKAVIKAAYDLDPNNTKALFIFGHVPVPYSGLMAPDGHGDHVGAWPADVYYADMDGVWTDTTANNTSASRSENRNVPGDGKFDQNSAPSDVELQVGRVDLSNMPAFAPKTELDLLRQYLNKDHNFRHGLLSLERRALVDDNFGAFGGEAFGGSGWRNFSTFFGASNVEAKKFFATLGTNSYLWGYGCGGGWYQGAGGVGSTNDFVGNDTKVVFTMLFGSYFGDWDSQDNFLRSPLATNSYGLTSAWAGRPHWQFHQMALGQNIGFSARLTQNENGLYQIYGNSVHVALMGDPTLRMHPVVPPSNLTVIRAGANVSLQWTVSPDADRGYLVFRANSSAGPFTKLTANPIATNNFIDANASSGSYTYQVRAVKLETSGSGTYFNSSQGIFKSAGRALYDFDGDGRADISVFRPSDNNWYLQRSSADLTTTQFAIIGDKIVPADYDGDGKTDIAVFRPASGTWYRFNSSNNQFTSVQLGQTGDFPAPGDYDGDGRADVTIFRPSTGLWYFINSSNNVLTNIRFGQTGDIPQINDFDGDGRADVSVYRQSNSTWYRLNSSNNQFVTTEFGASGDIPDAADFDGDGKTDLAVFRPSNGFWYLLQSTRNFEVTQYGQAGDRPAAADYDGDGKADIALFRPSTGIWYFNYSTRGFYATPFGSQGDVPIESAYVP